VAATIGTAEGKGRPLSLLRRVLACRQIGRTVMACGDHTSLSPIATRSELLRVLVVDDYRASADTMSSLVAAWGHEVQRAYDGNTGLALAAAYQPDVLLLDLIMPGVGGLTLVRQVQRQAHLNDRLMIAVTGRTDAGHRLQCEEAGIDLFLVKPVDLTFLRTLLGVESEYRLQARHGLGAQTFSTRLEQLMAPAYC
jgi:CheY-like chemotaxis protein